MTVIKWKIFLRKSEQNSEGEFMNSEHLHWRYATKKFDSKKVIPQPVLESVLEALRLSPSSFGLQPWKFLIIRDLELRKKIQPIARRKIF